MAEFDIDGDLVRKLSTLLDETGLTEIEFTDGERKIRVCKTVQIVAAAPQVTTAAEDASSGGDEPGALADHPGAVTAPMVGTAYLAPEPGAAVFAQVGQQISEGQTVLIIEAMKTMNHIPAPRSGKLTAVLVDDGQPVEFGEPLFVIE